MLNHTCLPKVIDSFLKFGQTFEHLVILSSEYIS